MDMNEKRWKRPTRLIYKLALSGRSMTTSEICKKLDITPNQLQGSIKTLNKHGVKLRRVGSVAEYDHVNKRFLGLQQGKLSLITNNKKTLIASLEKDKKQFLGRLNSLEESLYQGKITFHESAEVLSEIENVLTTIHVKSLEVKQRMAMANRQLRHKRLTDKIKKSQ